METPSAFSRAISANSSSVSRSDSAAVGSSITRMRAFWLIALAISTICCWATPSVLTTTEGSMSKPIVSSRRFASARILRRSMVPGMRPFGSRPRKMFWAMSR